MLCGHAATITDLDICFPITTEGHGETENTSNVVENSSSDGYGSLISACTDGVLCIWSRGSGHCKLRRRLPPWVGCPSSISTLPSSPRYVCVACCSVDSVHGSSHQYMDPDEGGEVPIDRESHHRRASKCAVVIVDSYSLNIVQTVFHGSLSIGPLKFMALVSSIENKEKQSVTVTDSLGGVQSMMIDKESDPDRKSGTVFHKKSSQTGVSVWADGLGDGDHLVTIAVRGELLALIHRTHCELRLGDGGVVIGEMSLIDSPLCDDSHDFQSHLEGGMFLVKDYGGSTSDNQVPPEQFVESFAVWSNRGAAIVFIISVSEDRFNFEPVCEIPAVSHSLDMKESSLWRPRITVWLLCQQHDSQGK